MVVDGEVVVVMVVVLEKCGVDSGDQVETAFVVRWCGGRVG